MIPIVRPTAIALAVLTPPTWAQSDDAKASRLIRHLELDERRDLAADTLMRMGNLALPALIRAVDDPRAEILSRIVRLLHGLGPDAKPAVPKLTRVAKGLDRRLAYAALWALAPFQPQGITVTTSMQRGCIREIDRDGLLIREIGNFECVTGAERLPNGNYLVCHSGIGLQELDRHGKEVWKSATVPYSVAAERLPNGNTLITGALPSRVVEIDRHGKPVWEYVAPHISRSTRLRSGSTLIVKGAESLVQLINPDGLVLWSFRAENSRPTDAHRLDNGNLLICCYDAKEIIEVTMEHAIVRRISVGGAPTVARRLVDGRTLVRGRSVGGVNFVAMFDADGQPQWRTEGHGNGQSLRHY